MYDVYPVSNNIITPEDVIAINREDSGLLLVDIKDTKNLSSEMLKDVSNKVKIHVTGPLKAEKYNKEKYFKRNTYSMRELKEIVRIMEDIEKNVNPKWDDMQKALYIYDTLSSKITYNLDYENDFSGNDQNLKPLISGEAVCAGYASIYYEMMNRQNIKCEYVRGRKQSQAHAWNILTIDGKTFPVDLTADAGVKIRHSSDKPLYFGNTELFNKYNLDTDEIVHEYTNLNQGYVQNNLDIVTGKSQLYDTMTRDDNSQFILSNLGLVDIDGYKVFKYAEAELNNGKALNTNILYSESDINALDDKAKDYFCNALLAKDRIKKYLDNNSNYIGGVEVVDNKFQKTIHNYPNEMLMNNVNNYTRENGTNVVISKTEKGSKIEQVNRYDCTEFINTRTGISLKNDIVYTKEDLLKAKDTKEKEFISNELLDQSHISESVKNSGGYIGNTTRLFGRYKISVDKRIERQFMEYQDTKKIA